MKLNYKLLFSIFFLISIPTFAQENVSENWKVEVEVISFEELMAMEVTTASNSAEKLSDAPASVIVISKEEIEKRGYLDLVELFNDLPGVDLAITYGDLYYKSYWRGFRKGMSSAFIMMVDGVIMNHLWFNWTDVLLAVPLSNVERVEVVYGPASSVYGPNAMMGVLNVITHKDAASDGAKFKAKIAGGSFDTRVADMNFFYKNGDFRVSLTGLLNHGDIDAESGENYEWTKSKYVKDKSLWGNFLNNDNIAGTMSSPRKVRTLTLNTYFKNLEFGAQYYRVGDMYGFNYAFDKIQPMSIWVQEDYSLFLRGSHSFSENFSTKVLLRYRRSDIPNSSASLEGWGSYGGNRTVAFGYWQSLNSSWSFYQDFDVKVNERLSFVAGIKYEQKDLQKNYDLPYGPNLNPDSVNISTYPYPVPPIATPRSENRVTWVDEGVYVQAKYDLAELLKINGTHNINLGIRWDRNSAYGENVTLRAGYVGSFGKLMAKVLYGEAIQEPTARELYASWAGLGSASTLKAEKSKTLEAYLNYTEKNYTLTLNPYYVNITDPINTVGGVPQNKGEIKIYGFDIHGKVQFVINAESNILFWGYYSYTTTDEKKFDAKGNQTGTGVVGDIANHKILLGSTYSYQNFSATLRGRIIGERETYDSNPVRKVDGFFTADINLLYKNLFVKGLSVSVKVNNIFDKEYFHTGIRDANSGITPGFWNNGKWYGSLGWSNSLLPQPGRSFIFGIGIDI